MKVVIELDNEDPKSVDLAFEMILPLIKRYHPNWVLRWEEKEPEHLDEAAAPSQR